MRDLMAIHVVRHADAGRRADWDGPDDERPLSRRGRGQADDIASELTLAAPARILSSPLVRCVETVQPLADALGIAVQLHPGLAEGAPLGETLSLMAEVASETVVVCSHGDVIPPLLRHLADRGARVQGSDPEVAKGSIWVVQGVHAALCAPEAAHAVS